MNAESELRVMLDGPMTPSRAYRMSAIASSAEGHWMAHEAHSRLASMFERIGDDEHAEQHNDMRKLHCDLAAR